MQVSISSVPYTVCIWNHEAVKAPAAKTPVPPSLRLRIISPDLFSQCIKVNKLKMLSGLNLRKKHLHHSIKMKTRGTSSSCMWLFFFFSENVLRQMIRQHSNAKLGTLLTTNLKTHKLFINQTHPEWASLLMRLKLSWQHFPLLHRPVPHCTSSVDSSFRPMRFTEMPSSDTSDASFKLQWNISGTMETKSLWGKKFPFPHMLSLILVVPPSSCQSS